MFSCCFHISLFIAFINNLLIPKEQYNIQMTLARVQNQGEPDPCFTERCCKVQLFQENIN